MSKKSNRNWIKLSIFLSSQVTGAVADRDSDSCAKSLTSIAYALPRILLPSSSSLLLSTEKPSADAAPKAAPDFSFQLSPSWKETVQSKTALLRQSTATGMLQSLFQKSAFLVLTKGYNRCTHNFHPDQASAADSNPLINWLELIRASP